MSAVELDVACDGRGNVEDTREMLQLWTRIAGKVCLSLAVGVNHWRSVPPFRLLDFDPVAVELKPRDYDWWLPGLKRATRRALCMEGSRTKSQVTPAPWAVQTSGLIRLNPAKLALPSDRIAQNQLDQVQCIGRQALCPNPGCLPTTSPLT